MKVLLSTFNGMRTLPRMFEALASLERPSGGMELHVSDNGSTDGTRDFLKAWKPRLPLEVYDAPVKGKNHALNFVLARIIDRIDPEELVVFTDDDVIPATNWLIALDQAAQDQKYTVFTGPIEPVWPGPVPDWVSGLTRYYGPLYSVRSREPGPCECIYAWGPNMAVRGSVFCQGLRFDGRFGPNGTKYFPMGSETQLMRRLDQLGHAGLFVSQAGVAHILREEALTREFIRARAFRHGLGLGQMNRRESRRGDLDLARLAVLNMAVSVLGWPLASRPDKARREYQWNWGGGLLLALVQSASHAAPERRETQESLPG